LKPEESRRWTIAQALLDDVLAQPGPKTRQAAQSRAAESGCETEFGALLAALDIDSALDHSLDDAVREFTAPALEQGALTGRVIDRWTLGEEIGRGGMSVVYHAHRDGDGFGQDAAMKILSMTFAGRAMLDGFLRERRILSGLQHPGIARLIDGGVTEEGSPWLVMEYVDGVRIDQWCREHDADTRTIVTLVEQLARAVAYAQRHLVIHRDINTANVLVNERGRPVLIDFGIAGLMGRETDTRTMHAFTPSFAAPEQVAGKDCTTATDVYAIGRLLDTLLTDSSVDRDLRLLVDSATREDPELRYANARNLAEDLQAWLEKRPLRARPPSFRYRAGRFVARNRWGVAAAALLVVAIAGGTAAALWQARIAAAERDVAQAESARAHQVTTFLQNLFRASSPDEAQGEAVTARQLLDIGGHQIRDAFADDPALKGEMLVLLGELYTQLGEQDTAIPMLREGQELASAHGDVAERVVALRSLARAEMDAGDHQAAVAHVETAEALLREAGEVPGPLHATLVEPLLFSMAELGQAGEAVERAQSMLAGARAAPDLPGQALYDYLYATAIVMGVAEMDDDAEPLLREAAAMDVVAEAQPSNLIGLRSTLASALEQKGDLEAGLALRRQSLAIAEQVYPPGHVIRARMQSNLGSVLNRMGRFADAVETLRAALAIYEDIYGDKAHPRVAAAHNNLGNALKDSGDLEAAEFHASRAQRMAGEIFGTDDFRYTIATANLGNLNRLMGRYETAESLLNESLDIRRATLGPTHYAVGSGLAMLAMLRLDQARYDEALVLCDDALAVYDAAGYDSPRERIAVMTRRARALDGLGRTDAAATQYDAALALAKAAGANAGSSLEELNEAHAEFVARTSHEIR